MSIVYGVKSNATRGAKRALKLAGVESPAAGIHYEVVECEGGYEFLDIRPSVIEAAALENTADLEVAACLNAAKEQAELDVNNPDTWPAGIPIKEGEDLTVEWDSAGTIDLAAPPCAPKFADLFPNGVKLVTVESPEDGSMHDEVEALPLVQAALVDDSVIAAIYAMASARATRPAPKKSRGWMALYETMAAKGEMPPRHLVTSLVNMHMQKHFDALHAMATAHDREGLLSYPLKGSNSYAQECRRWRDLLVKAVNALPVPVAA